MIGEELDAEVEAEAEGDAAAAAAAGEEGEDEDEDEDEAATRAILNELRSMEAMLKEHGASTLPPDERMAEAFRQAAADAAACEPCQMKGTDVKLTGNKREAQSGAEKA